MTIDVESYVNREKEKIKNKIATFEEQPCLMVIQVGDNQASNSYIKGKKKDCEEVGIKFIHSKIETEVDLIQAVLKANVSNNIHGVIVQLPIPFGTNILSMINKNKDVDGFGSDTIFTPCTPMGIMEILANENINVDGKNVVILGRSEIVGKPMAKLMLDENATVTICHSHTKNISQYTQNADIVISAVGKRNFVTKDMVNKNAVIVDVGINRDENGKLCGDVDRECYDYCTVTPVPKGVGLTTRLALLKNVVKAYEMWEARKNLGDI